MKIKKYLLVAIFSVLMTGGLIAQPGDGGSNGGGGGTRPGAPIDGGLVSLVVAGIALGLKKTRK